MRSLRALLVMYGLLSAGFLVSGATLSFSEQNFSIEIPKGWIPIDPRPPQTVVAMQRSDGSKKLLVLAARVPDKESSSAGVNFRAGIKDSLVAQGWKFDADQQSESGELPFVCLIAHNPSDNHSMLAYTLVDGNQTYAVMFILSKNAKTSDTELREIIRSFRLLSNKV